MTQTRTVEGKGKMSHENEALSKTADQSLGSATLTKEVIIHIWKCVHQATPGKLDLLLNATDVL